MLTFPVFSLSRLKNSTLLLKSIGHLNDSQILVRGEEEVEGRKLLGHVGSDLSRYLEKLEQREENPSTEIWSFWGFCLRSVSDSWKEKRSGDGESRDSCLSLSFAAFCLTIKPL